ncbi:hypothetical protein H072_67 [Dactylellina haptotyla CBS 200.50]|uniref:Apple domain-containing protein n=1 Tax=Dactylellina haptotyla (strain CBS 200.50) TaxID=1284197 RepID=S8ASH4_DACHA|nr:hypothetical protein H072_67 [Dactylellina haptotyla CBS 200.50]
MKVSLSLLRTVAVALVVFVAPAVQAQATDTTISLITTSASVPYTSDTTTSTKITTSSISSCQPSTKWFGFVTAVPLSFSTSVVLDYACQTAVPVPSTCSDVYVPIYLNMDKVTPGDGYLIEWGTQSEPPAGYTFETYNLVQCKNRCTGFSNCQFLNAYQGVLPNGTTSYRCATFSQYYTYAGASTALGWFTSISKSYGYSKVHSCTCPEYVYN